MNTAKKYVIAGFALSMVLGSVANAANKKDEDSVYQWGRWAVLSPAAGGANYVAPPTPDVAFNARPGDPGFQPEVEVQIVNPPVFPQPPVVVPNPPGAQPPIGDGRIRPPVVVGSPTNPPIADGRRR